MASTASSSSEILPYSVTRTWHVQTGHLLDRDRVAGGRTVHRPAGERSYEPKFQSLGVNVLFGALLLIVAGSLTGEWLSIMNKLTDAQSFLWGHQGYEYVDLGRVWQVLLFVGLLHLARRW